MQEKELGENIIKNAIFVDYGGLQQVIYDENRQIISGNPPKNGEKFSGKVEFIDKKVVFLGFFNVHHGHLITDELGKFWWILKNGAINFNQNINSKLHFGDSWNLIGNIVLANPGSAKPKRQISDEDWQLVRQFLQKYPRNDDKNILAQDNWREFEPDSTMRQVEKLFSGSYTHTNIKRLDGVIQLFNCFNVKNHNLDEAIKNIKQYDQILCFSNNIWKYFYDKPVYFGFSQSVLKTPILRKNAEDIFKNTPINLRQIYKKQFDENHFYHLGYVNRAYKTIDYTEEILKPFVELLAQQVL